MIKQGQKTKILYINTFEYVKKECKFVYKTIKKNYYIIDGRSHTNGYYGFHESSWAVDECSWLFTEKDLDKIKEYDGEAVFYIYSERPYSKEEMQAKVKEFLDVKKQKYIDRIDSIINKLYEA